MPCGKFTSHRHILLVVAVATLNVTATRECSALITGGFGNDPVQDQGWPAGSLDVANLESRVGWWEGPPFGGGMYVFLYRDKDTAAVNQALVKFSQIKSSKLEVVLHDGPYESFWLRDHQKPADEAQPKARVDWTFTVWRPESWHRLYNDPRSAFSSDRKEFRQPVDPPRIDIYIGDGSIKFGALKLPETITVRDERQEAAPVKLEGGSLIRGRVTDMLTGKPIAKAEVQAVKTIAKPEGGYETQRVAHAVTDDTGNYELSKLDPAARSIGIRAAGYASRSVEVDAGEKPVYRMVDAELAPEASISGRVVNEVGDPIAGVIVSTTTTLAVDGRGYASAGYRKAETNNEGRFDLKDLPRGYVQLSYRKDRYYHTPLGELLAVPGETVEITMVRTGTIRGKVTAAGKPVSDTSVMLEQEGKKEGTWGGVGTWGGGMNTNAEGHFEFAGAPPGNYRIQANGQTKTITLAGGETAEVELTN
jgi:hypothetical protein